MLRTLFQVAGRNVCRGTQVGQRCAASVSSISMRHYTSHEKTTSDTMADVKTNIMDRLGLEHGYNPIQKSREHLLQYEPKAEDLPPRTMQDSFTSAVLPLGSDKNLQDKYVSILGHVRTGRIMEEMDMFAVWVCHQHLKIPQLPENVHLPYTFVTILVDKISFSDLRPSGTADIRFSGHVSWVGRSSLEVVVWVEQCRDGINQKITRALFLMAARNATNTGPAPVNRIEPANDEEKKILSGGEERKKHRQNLQANSIFKVEPNDFEQTLMWQLFNRTTDINTMELNKRILPNNCRWMSDSYSMNTMASFPENRNAHNTVFGGFLMRSALEISFVGASMYANSRPTLVRVCDISFNKPVKVSSFIKMTAYVVYTDMNYIQMMTVADVLESGVGGQTTTNVFYYTFKVAETVPEVLPRSYHESIWYIHGRRQFRYAMDLP